MILGADFGSAPVADAAGCHSVYSQLAATDRRFAGRYLGLGGGLHHTREEALIAASYGIRSIHVAQNYGAAPGTGHSEEIWNGWEGYAPGYSTGRALADEWRGQQLTITQAAPFFSAADKPWAGERGMKNLNGPYPWPVAVEFFRGARSRLGQAHNGVYGPGEFIRTMMELDNPPCSIYWLSFLLDGIYWDPPRAKTDLRSLPRMPDLIQFGNADQDPTLRRFGIPLGSSGDPRYSYVGHDRTPDSTLGDFAWYPA